MAKQPSSGPETPPAAGKLTFFSFLVYLGLVTYATECLRALRGPLIPFYHVFFGYCMVCLLLWLHFFALSESEIELLGPLLRCDL